MSDNADFPEWKLSPIHMYILEKCQEPGFFIPGRDNIIQELLRDKAIAQGTLEDKVYRNIPSKDYFAAIEEMQLKNLPIGRTYEEKIASLVVFDREKMEAIYGDKIAYRTTEFGMSILQDFNDKYKLAAVSLRKSVFDLLIAREYESAAKAITDFEVKWKVIWEENYSYEKKLLENLQNIQTTLSIQPRNLYVKYPQELIRKLNIIVLIGHLFWDPHEERNELWKLLVDEPGFNRKEVTKNLYGDFTFKLHAPPHLAYSRAQRARLPKIDYQIIIDFIGWDRKLRDRRTIIIPLNDYNVERFTRVIKFLNENDSIFTWETGFRLAKLDNIQGEILLEPFDVIYDDERNWIYSFMQKREGEDSRTLVKKGPAVEYPFISIPIYRPMPDLSLTLQGKELITLHLNGLYDRYDKEKNGPTKLLRLKFMKKNGDCFLITLQVDKQTASTLLRLWEVISREDFNDPGVTYFEFFINNHYIDATNLKRIGPWWIPFDPDEDEGRDQLVFIQLRDSSNMRFDEKQTDRSADTAPDWSIVSEDSVTAPEYRKYKERDEGGYKASVIMNTNGEVKFSLEELETFPVKKYFSVKTWTVEEFAQLFSIHPEGLTFTER